MPLSLGAQIVTIEGTLRVLATSEIGAFDGARWVLPLPDGSLIVPNAADRALERWSTTGRLMARWGRRGEGPGEFRLMLNGGTAGSALWVNDPAQQRTTFYDMSGTLQGVVRWSPVVSISDGWSDRGGSGALTPRAWVDTTTYFGVLIPTSTRGTTPGVRLARASRTRGIEATHELSVQAPGTGPCATANSRTLVLRCPTALHAFSSDGGWFAHVTQAATDDRMGWYRLDVRRTAGSGVHSDSVPVARARIEPSRADALRRRTEMAVQGTGVPASARPRVAELPDHDRSAEELFVASDGTAWVRVAPGTEGRQLWHRHRIGTSRVGRWLAPPDLTVLWVGPSTVVGRLVGEDGVTRLVEWRFPR